MKSIYMLSAVACATLLTACAGDKDSAATPVSLASYSSNNGGGSSGSSTSYNPTVPDYRTIRVDSYPANLPLSCDYFNPDAIKSLSPDVIRWMAEIFPSGINRYEHFMLIRDQGYDGEIGQGGHNAFLAAVPARRTAFERAVTAYANQSYLPTYNTLAAHHATARALGYQGVFLCGGHLCWAAGQCDSLGRRL